MNITCQTSKVSVRQNGVSVKCRPDGGGWRIRGYFLVAECGRFFFTSCERRERTSERSERVSSAIAQNAYCSRDIYLQLTKYLRSFILPSIIQMNAGMRASLVKINALFSRREYDLAH